MLERAQEVLVQLHGLGVAPGGLERLLGQPAPLLLAVEVLSPSTRSVDLLLKHGVYAESGVASYWVVDPSVPSVRAWRLQHGTYVEVGGADGEQALVLEHPFTVRVVPVDLLDL